ncbi:integrase catalytic domain-containing protein [Trichonephila clavipes]|nr:integrase catalytic domain-containing protein [Trichonephila clavipes]
MFKNCRKEDFRIIALELGETVAEKVTIVELTDIIKENKYFKKDIEFVKELNLRSRTFWEIENVEIDSVKTSELDICEDHFKNTHSGDDQGRYTGAMQLKEDPSCLGESRQTAIQRLNSLWKRLIGDKEYLSLYEKFLQEYEDLGHMRGIKADGFGVAFYMPHHSVYHPEKFYN